MTATEEKNVFNSKIVPVMDKIHKSAPNIGMDMYFTAVVAQLRKQNVPLSNNLVNAIMDKMAKDSMPKSSTGYVTGKILDNNIVKTVFDWSHPSARDTPLETEIKRRAELMYKPSGKEQTIASLATATTDIFATAPVAVLSPQSAVYGYLIQGGYDIANNKIFLPESDEEKKQTASQAMSRYYAVHEKTNASIVPPWMMKRNGFTDYKSASDGKLKIAKSWAETQASSWKSFHDKLKKPGDTVNVNGKLFTKNECYVKEQQYRLFATQCGAEINARTQAQKAAAAKAQAESSGKEVTLDSIISDDKNSDNEQKASVIPDIKGFDPWGQLLNTLGFNGLGNVGKHLGYTLATLPDAIFGIFTGKTKSVGMDKDTLIPVASLVAGKFVRNPMLKAALMGYGGLNLINKLGNEQIAQRENTQQNTQTTVSAQGVKFRKYDEEPLNPRITNLQIQGNSLIADIDKVPCTITLPDTVVLAYNSGALPLSTLANAVLAKNDSLNQQISQAYEQSQKQEQSRGIR